MYTIERIRTIDDIDGETAHFMQEVARLSVEKYDSDMDWRKVDFLGYARDGMIWICRKDGRPVGQMMARLYPSIFDPDIAILFQDSLFCMPGSGRAAHLLMREFIDFGRANANHVFTAIAQHTNIKGRSLEKLGFKKVEEAYRLEF